MLLCTPSKPILRHQNHSHSFCFSICSFQIWNHEIALSATRQTLHHNIAAALIPVRFKFSGRSQEGDGGCGGHDGNKRPQWNFQYSSSTKKGYHRHGSRHWRGRLCNLVLVLTPKLFDIHILDGILDDEQSASSASDDMMAIFMAFQAPEIEVIGFTTIFGNVNTELATINALHLCEMAGFPDLPVAEGPSESLQHVKPRIASFVHGSDGLGETHQAKPKGQKLPISAADFLVEKVAEFPSEITVVALGPLTNIALAIRKDPGFAKNIGQLVVLGGAFNACGNVNPAAEANVSLKRQKSHSRNIFGDPEAADLVFTAGLNTLAIGINLTTQVVFSEQDLCDIRDSGGKYGQYVYDCCRFYHKWHIDSDHFDGIFLHDPTCIAALLDPSLFTFRKGAVRVETQGRCVGHTLLDYGLKNWVGNNPWIGVPPIDVGITVDVSGVRKLVKKYLCSS